MLIRPYGSLNYGTWHQNSDVDVIAVIEYGETQEQFDEELFKMKTRFCLHGCSDFDMQTYTNTDFVAACHRHEPWALEVLMLCGDQDYVNFTLDREKLRSGFGAVISNSWVKCRKKLTVEGPDQHYIGRKSMFHCLRIIQFGIQIAKAGTITDFHEARPLYDRICKSEKTWPELDAEFRKLKNELHSEFRAACLSKV